MFAWLRRRKHWRRHVCNRTQRLHPQYQPSQVHPVQSTIVLLVFSSALHYWFYFNSSVSTEYWSNWATSTFQQTLSRTSGRVPSREASSVQRLHQQDFSNAFKIAAMLQMHRGLKKLRTTSRIPRVSLVIFHPSEIEPFCKKWGTTAASRLKYQPGTPRYRFNSSA